MADTEVSCANRECRIAQDGKCLEGYDDLNECPYYGKELEERGEDDQADEHAIADAFDGVHIGLVTVLRRSPERLELATGDRRDDQA
ncbi:MAG: hypothetical protein QHC67_18755, partial [Sphingobium sp.]|uniref:hypothetical protein n=1 Tax=Sphingobium sp. TaxID=1912891 RepID=UPI0029BCA239